MVASDTPPPCTLHYLLDICPYGAACRFGHNYILKPEHYDDLLATTKAAPCLAVKKGTLSDTVSVPFIETSGFEGEHCQWGDKCIYGHSCPQPPPCHYLKQGRCKFTAGGYLNDV